jgi:pimeloyl-ACP methyl ester carboxylesterase
LGGHGGLKTSDDTSVLDKLAESLEQGKGLAPLFIALTPAGKPAPSAEQIKTMDQRILAINDPKALAAVVRSWKGLVVTDEKLKANKVPTLALIGELDPLKRGVDPLQSKLSGVRIVVIKDADHMNAFTRPEFVAELKGFLAAHSSTVKAAEPKKPSSRKPVGIAD